MTPCRTRQKLSSRHPNNNGLPLECVIVIYVTASLRASWKVCGTSDEGASLHNPVSKAHLTSVKEYIIPFSLYLLSPKSHSQLEQI
jgi:hypothetical protein